MKETLKNTYEVPVVTIVTVYVECLLCQSKGAFGAEHGGFVGDDGNPEDLW